MFVFPDIDGVLNREKDWKNPYTLNQECLCMFGECFSETNVKIILVSSWRKGFISPGNSNNTPQIKKLEEKMRDMGLRIAGTVSHFEADRKKSIQDFIIKHPDSYIILDDDLREYGNEKMEGLYLVNNKTGLTQKDVKEIRKRTGSTSKYSQYINKDIA